MEQRNLNCKADDRHLYGRSDEQKFEATVAGSSSASRASLTAKKLLELSKHWRFVGYKIDWEFFHSVRLSMTQ